MSRSQRCAAVVTRAITAVALCAGAGLAVTAPAEAEPAGSDSAGPGSHSAGRVSKGGEPHVPGTTPPGVRPDNTPGVRPDSVPKTTRAGRSHVRNPVGEPRKWPCKWPADLRPGNNDDNDYVPAQPAFQVPAVPEAQISGGVVPRLPALDPAPAPIAAPVPAPNGASVPNAQPVPVVGRPAATGASPFAPRSARTAPPPSAPRTATAVPLTVPAPGSSSLRPEPPESVRLGYPAELRHADLATVAALALPGLAAIFGMTALGGFVGYRQAKAGYVLRTAGAGRFLQ